MQDTTCRGLNTRLLTCILGGLALGVVEISGHCDDRILDRLAQEALCRLLHLGQDHGTDLLRGENLHSKGSGVKVPSLVNTGSWST